MSSPARLAHTPALDGLRGLAVAAVLLFHGEVPGFRGGHLGVTAFFTLSGFLITALLLIERRSTGRIDLPAFWRRRACRLVPAALLCLPLVAVVVALSPVPPTDDVTWDAIAAAAWLANWRFVLDEQTYDELFALPSPFQHFWSLAVEEQFYLVFPLLVIALLGTASVLRVRRLAVVLTVLTTLSTVQLYRLYEAGQALGRGYYGTDARIDELLVGALLAVALAGGSGMRAPGRWAGPVGIAGLGGLLAGFLLLDKGHALLYRGGYLAMAVCTAGVVAAALRPGSLVARLLSLRAIVGLGIVSYGVYLFHWPLFLLLTGELIGGDPVSLFLIRVAATLGLAWASYQLVEWPVRHGGLLRGWSIATGWASSAVAGVAAVAVAAGQLVLPLPEPSSVPGVPAPELGEVAPPAVAAPGGASGAPPGPRRSGESRTTAPDVQIRAPGPGQQQPPPQGAPVRPRVQPREAQAPQEFRQDPSRSKVPPVPEAPPGALRVVTVGDSIGVNLGQGLQSWAQSRSDVVVYNLALPACPISRGGERRIGPGRPFPVSPSCGWWSDADAERRQALEKFAPDVVVVQDGVNEVFDRRQPQWQQWRRPGEPQFDNWLVSEYLNAASTWGASLLVTNAPCADWRRYEHFDDLEDPELRVTALNLHVYNRMPEVQVADLHQRLCPGGRYRDEVEGVPDGRPDGFHLSREASAALARNWLGSLVLETADDSIGPLGGGA